MIFIRKILKKEKKLSMLLACGILALFFTIKTGHHQNPSSTISPMPKTSFKQPVETAIQQYPGWIAISSVTGDSLHSLFTRAGLSQEILQTLLFNNPYKHLLQPLKVNQIYYFKIQQKTLQELVFEVDKKHFLTISLQAKQGYQTILRQGNIDFYLTHSSSWNAIIIQPGDTLGKIFQRVGLSYQTMLNIMHHNPQQKILTRLKPQRTIYFQIQNHQLQAMIFPIHSQKYLLIRRHDQGYQTLVRIGKPTVFNSSLASQILLKPITVAPTTQEGWITISPRSGDSLTPIFQRAGLGQKDLHNVLYKNPYARQLNRIHLNDKIRFHIQNHQLIEMVFNLDALHYLSIKKQGDLYQTKLEKHPQTENIEYISTPVSGSLYKTAQTAGIPTKLIEQIKQIFYWQVQLANEIRPGDRLNLAFQTIYVNGKKVATGDILAVSYQHRNGIKYEAIRHQSRNGQVQYYHPNGSSLKKAFSRYPIRFSHISSNFGSARKHPILNYRRPHKGIDLAAPIGTPIYAIGDGQIAFIGRQNGYGNMIKINHAFSYTSVYAHMLRFQKGLHHGSRVQKGQIIGFVGQSGLATGPHCHYELHINHIPRNPTSVALPQALPIIHQEFAAFHRFSQHILSQMHLYEATKLAHR